MIITTWYRRGDGEWIYSHYSSGYHPHHEQPAPMFPEQERSWSKEFWQGRKAELIDGKVVNEVPA
jgi:hypothetical protein